MRRRHSKVPVEARAEPFDDPCTLESYCIGYLLRFKDGGSILFQTDWDFPCLASNFGWVPCRECGDTDGTVDCPHRTVDEMMAEAIAYLDEHIGDTIENPGYEG